MNKAKKLQELLDEVKANNLREQKKRCVANLKEDDNKYQEFFRSALKKFGIKSPAELKDDDKKKEFFSYIDSNYDAVNEASFIIKQQDRNI